MQLQTRGDSPGAGHQRRLYSDVWCLSRSGWNGWGTARNLFSPCSLSSRVAGPFYMVAQGSMRVEAEASRPLRASACCWSSTTSVPARARACSRSRAGECPRSAGRTKNVWPILTHHGSLQKSSETASFSTEIMETRNQCNDIFKAGRRKLQA